MQCQSQDSRPDLVSRQPSIAVAVNVYQESVRQITECFERIATNLRDAKVAVFINGEDRPEVFALAARWAFTAIQGENLGTNCTWHLWWRRMVEFFGCTGCEICFKFDPDTMVDRRPKYFPRSPYFGKVDFNAAFNLFFVQGGVTGFSRSAIARVLDARVLEPAPEKIWLTVQLPPSVSFADDQLFAFALRHIGILPSPVV